MAVVAQVTICRRQPERLYKSRQDHAIATAHAAVGRAGGPSNPSSMRPTPTKADGDSVAAGAWNTAGGVSKANAAFEQKWRDEVREKEQALALRTRAVKDLKAAREELNKIKAELNESKRSFMMCRLLTHARSKIGRSAQLIRPCGAAGSEGGV